MVGTVKVYVEGISVDTKILRFNDSEFWEVTEDSRMSYIQFEKLYIIFWKIF